MSVVLQSAGGGTVTLDTVSTAANTTLILPTGSSTVATTDTAQTLSNKTFVAPALGTPTALVGTNITGTAAGLTAGNVTTNANLTGAVTSSGNATSLGSFTSAQLAGALTDETGTGANVFATSPTLVTPVINGFTGDTSVINIGSGQVYKDASGNVGIGTSSPSSFGKLSVVGGGIYTNNGYALTGDATYFTPSGLTAIPNYGIGNPASNQVSLSAFSGLTFYTNQNERMRIDSSGNLLVGTTSVPFFAGKLQVSGGAQDASGINVSGNFTGTHYVNTANTGWTPLKFWVNGTSNTVGTISVSTTATAYNTSSDYRLKNTIAPMTGALDKVALLKPCTYKWKVDGSDSQGFIAHELAEVEPGCVTGEKDAVDAEGKPQYQGIDTSFLVATLTAAIQEQQALIQSLTTRITALEGAAA